MSSGFREHFNPESLCIVEWPEMAEGLLSPPDLHVTLEIAEPGRRVGFLARSAAGREWRSTALASLLRF